MTVATRYIFNGLSTSGSAVHVPVERGGLQVAINHVLDRLQAAPALKPDLILNRGNRVELNVTTFDPSFLTAWTEYGSGKTYTGIGAFWRQFEQNAGLSTTYISWGSAQGILVPVSLAAQPGTKATLNFRVIPLWATGTLFTISTSSNTAPTVAKGYYPTSIVVGSDTVIAIESLQLDWSFDINFDDQYQPSYCFYLNTRITGRARLKDLAQATAARLVGKKETTLTTYLTDAGIGGGTLVNTLGNCWVQGVIADDSMDLQFEQIA